MIFSENIYIMADPKIQNVLFSIAQENFQSDETVFLAIKGAFKEYIFATDRSIYIYKTWFMTGRTFGYSLFQLDHANISSVQLHKNFGGTGYIEIVGIGMQNQKDLSYWSSDKDKNPSRMENMVSFSDIRLASEVVKRIRELISKNNGGNYESIHTSEDKFEEIKKFKELLDMDIITKEEFEQKKNELLK